MFEDRTEAGEKLGTYLREKEVSVDLVLAIPRGGLPVGRKVADALKVPLDVVVSKKMGAPGNPELAIGAVGSDGSAFLNDELIERLGVEKSYVEKKRKEKSVRARKKLEKYGGGPETVEGKSVLVVDDGIATGATTTACINSLRNMGAEEIFLAVPVAPADSYQQFGDLVDGFFALSTPENFGAVGQFYRNFSQVSDREAVEYMSEKRLE